MTSTTAGTGSAEGSAQRWGPRWGSRPEDWSGERGAAAPDIRGDLPRRRSAPACTCSRSAAGPACLRAAADAARPCSTSTPHRRCSTSRAPASRKPTSTWRPQSAVRGRCLRRRRGVQRLLLRRRHGLEGAPAEPRASRCPVAGRDSGLGRARALRPRRDRPDRPAAVPRVRPGRSTSPDAAEPGALGGSPLPRA